MAKVAQAESTFLENARELVPKLWERAQETENIRRIPEATMKELKEAGLISMLRPKQYGGFETNMRTYSDVIVEVSKGCASTGWVLALCSIRELMVAESFSEKAHKEIFGKVKMLYLLGCTSQENVLPEKWMAAI